MHTRRGKALQVGEASAGANLIELLQFLQVYFTRPYSSHARLVWNVIRLLAPFPHGGEETDDISD